MHSLNSTRMVRINMGQTPSRHSSGYSVATYSRWLDLKTSGALIFLNELFFAISFLLYDEKIQVELLYSMAAILMLASLAWMYGVEFKTNYFMVPSIVFTVIVFIFLVIFNILLFLHFLDIASFGFLAEVSKDGWYMFVKSITLLVIHGTFCVIKYVVYKIIMGPNKSSKPVAKNNTTLPARNPPN